MYFRDGKLVLRGNGDNYTGNVQGRDRVGDLKFLPGDPKLGQPWMHRTGGCIVYNKRTGFGSYEIDALIPNNLGCAYTMDLLQ
jgi:hypothetical protein